MFRCAIIAITRSGLNAFDVLLGKRVFSRLVEELPELPLSDVSETSTVTHELVDFL